MKYSRISTNGYLSTAATFLADSPYIDSCLNLSTMATSLQRALSSVPKAAVVKRFNGSFFYFFIFCLYCSVTGRHLQVSRIQILKMPVMTGGANFPHLQPMAELQRNKRGEIGRQHVKAHYAAASVHADLTSPTQTNDSTCQIDHDTGAYDIYSFRTMSTGSFTSRSNRSVRIKQTRIKQTRPTA